MNDDFRRRLLLLVDVVIAVDMQAVMKRAGLSIIQFLQSIRSPLFPVFTQQLKFS